MPSDNTTIRRGVYSSLFETTDRRGNTVSRKVYWSVKPLPDGDAEVQPLNKNFVATGSPKRVERETFLAKFRIEEGFFLAPSPAEAAAETAPAPEPRELSRPPSPYGGDEDENLEDIFAGWGKAALDHPPLDEEKPARGAAPGVDWPEGWDEVPDLPPAPAPWSAPAAEPEAPPAAPSPEAVRRVEREIIDSFHEGLGLLLKGQTTKAEKVFELILARKEGIEVEHKHNFNDFGIDLRRNRRFAQALKFYERALELAPDDENLFFNAARAFHEKGDAQKANFFLNRALDINPDLEPALRFKRWLERNKPAVRPDDGIRFAD